MFVSNSILLHYTSIKRQYLRQVVYDVHAIHNTSMRQSNTSACSSSPTSYSSRYNCLQFKSRLCAVKSPLECSPNNDCMQLIMTTATCCPYESPYL
uniref:Uncharacterized protein n=1 Tax=Pararge aegeria TaxID=116150 RepID=S4NYW1_9NEOP